MDDKPFVPIIEQRHRDYGSDVMMKARGYRVGIHDEHFAVQAFANYEREHLAHFTELRETIDVARHMLRSHEGSASNEGDAFKVLDAARTGSWMANRPSEAEIRQLVGTTIDRAAAKPDASPTTIGREVSRALDRLFSRLYTKTD